MGTSLLKHVLLLLFSIISLVCPAQNGDIEILKHDAAIFRGPVKETYPYYFTGTPYLNKAEFEKTSLKYNRKWYHNVELNLDICRGELCVKVPNSGIIITLDNNLADEFTLNGHKFVNIGNNVAGIQNSLCELIYEGVYAGSLVKEHVKKYTRENRGNIVFYTVTQLYLVKDNNAYRLKGTRTFLKAYPHLKKEIKKKVRTLDYSIPELFYSSLIQFIDSKESPIETGRKEGGSL